VQLFCFLHLNIDSSSDKSLIILVLRTIANRNFTVLTVEFTSKPEPMQHLNWQAGKHPEVFMKNPNHEPKPSNKELVEVIKKRKLTAPDSDEKPTIILPDKKP
tara:strand:- start:7710 stop:8018 length:309 start_codon:yes stop_codon:yes gene_type:complete